MSARSRVANLIFIIDGEMGSVSKDDEPFRRYRLG